VATLLKIASFKNYKYFDKSLKSLTIKVALISNPGDTNLNFFA